MIHRSRTVAGSSRERWVYVSPVSFTNGRRSRPRQAPRRLLLRQQTPVWESKTLPTSNPTYPSDRLRHHERNAGSTESSSTRRPSRDASRRASVSAPACRSTRACQPTPARAATHASRHSASSVTRPACDPGTPRLLPSSVLCPSMNQSRTNTCVTR
jgi:hypothetical protein